MKTNKSKIPPIRNQRREQVLCAKFQASWLEQDRGVRYANLDLFHLGGFIRHKVPTRSKVIGRTNTIQKSRAFIEFPF